MRKVVDIVIGPSRPETGGVARAVTLDNGWGQIQTYSQHKKAWVEGGSSLQSLWTSEDLTPEMLEEMGYDEEDIEKIFRRPDGQEVR